MFNFVKETEDALKVVATKTVDEENHDDDDIDIVIEFRCCWCLWRVWGFVWKWYLLNCLLAICLKNVRMYEQSLVAKAAAVPPTLKLSHKKGAFGKRYFYVHSMKSECLLFKHQRIIFYLSADSLIPLNSCSWRRSFVKESFREKISWNCYGTLLHFTNWIVFYTSSIITDLLPLR